MSRNGQKIKIITFFFLFIIHYSIFINLSFREPYSCTFISAIFSFIAIVISYASNEEKSWDIKIRSIIFAFIFMHIPIVIGSFWREGLLKQSNIYLYIIKYVLISFCLQATASSFFLIPAIFLGDFIDHTKVENKERLFNEGEGNIDDEQNEFDDEYESGNVENDDKENVYGEGSGNTESASEDYSFSNKEETKVFRDNDKFNAMNEKSEIKIVGQIGYNQKKSIKKRRKKKLSKRVINSPIK